MIAGSPPSVTPKKPTMPEVGAKLLPAAPKHSDPKRSPAKQLLPASMLNVVGACTPPGKHSTLASNGDMNRKLVGLVPAGPSLLPLGVAPFRVNTAAVVAPDPDVKLPPVLHWLPVKKVPLSHTIPLFWLLPSWSIWNIMCPRSNDPDGAP